MAQRISGIIVRIGLAAALLRSGVAGHAEDLAETQRQLRQLQQQNEALQEQLRQQQALIESLSKTVKEIQAASANRIQEIESLKTELKEPPPPKPSGAFSFNNVHISGEGGLAFFDTGSQGNFPNGELRVDEARLFVEAPVIDSTFCH